MKTIIFVLLSLILSFHSLSAQPQESERSKQLVSLVDKAAALVENKGKDVFPDLRKKDGDWWKGELYVFVDGLDGIVLVHPGDPTIEGQNLLEDAASKAVMQALIDKATTSGSGWVEYMWPKPGETVPSKKMSYIRKVKMPDGRLVIVGAGMYATTP